MRVLMVAALLASATPAIGHDAPTGWRYDFSCCSGKDCAPEHSEVKAVEGGWFVAATGEVIPYSSKKIRDSKDGDFHRCIYQKAVGEHAKGSTRCLYVPSMGF